MLRHEASASWVSVERSPFARLAPKNNRIAIVGFVVLAGLCGVFVLGFLATIQEEATKKAKDDGPPIVRVEAKSRPEPEGELVCQIQIPGSPGRVPGFPTEADMDEYSKAAAQGLSDEDITVIALSNGGKLIEAGTKCFWVDAGFLRTRARMLEGPFTGQVFWFPSEWTRQRVNQ